jgi:hypothetical protein
MNREKARARWRRFRQRHPEKRREFETHRRRDPAERAADALGRKIRHILKGTFPSDISALGYDGDELRRHVESQFLPGMSWANYGEWHIDHIKPRSTFRLPNEIFKCFALSNLRPLWAIDNISQRHRK